MPRRCKSCEWFEMDSNDEAGKWGLCHRNPPDHQYCWPGVKPMDFCGEHKALPAKKSTEEKEVDMNIKLVVKHYQDTFKEIFDHRPVITAADTKAVKKLLSDIGLENTKWCVTKFLEEPPPWNREHNVYDLRSVIYAANKIMARR